jgi:hypothetical protein
MAISKSGEFFRRETKSRHALKHDGSLFRLVDRFSDYSRPFAVQACALQAGAHFLDPCLLPET